MLYPGQIIRINDSGLQRGSLPFMIGGMEDSRFEINPLSIAGIRGVVLMRG